MPRLNFSEHTRITRPLNEVDAANLAVLHVNKLAPRVAGVTAAACHEHSATREGHAIDGEHVRRRTESAVTVLTVAVTNECRSFFEREMHSRDPRLAGPLHAVAIEIGKHLADDARVTREDAAGNQHARSGDARPHGATRRLRHVHPVAALRTRSEP